MRLILSGLLIGVALTLGGCFEGPKGDKGDRGEQGIPGKDGAPGKDGVAGKDGAPGKDGASGKDGAPGKDGAAGKDGVPGKDGAPGRDGASAIRMLVHACQAAECKQVCDKGERLVNAICVGRNAARFTVDPGNPDLLVADCGDGPGTMHLFCMKP